MSIIYNNYSASQQAKYLGLRDYPQQTDTKKDRFSTSSSNSSITTSSSGQYKRQSSIAGSWSAASTLSVKPLNRPGYSAPSGDLKFSGCRNTPSAPRIREVLPNASFYNYKKAVTLTNAIKAIKRYSHSHDQLKINDDKYKLLNGFNRFLKASTYLNNSKEEVNGARHSVEVAKHMLLTGSSSKKDIALSRALSLSVKDFSFDSFKKDAGYRDECINQLNVKLQTLTVKKNPHEYEIMQAAIIYINDERHSPTAKNLIAIRA